MRSLALVSFLSLHSSSYFQKTSCVFWALSLTASVRVEKHLRTCGLGTPLLIPLSARISMSRIGHSMSDWVNYTCRWVVHKAMSLRRSHAVHRRWPVLKHLSFLMGWYMRLYSELLPQLIAPEKMQRFRRFGSSRAWLAVTYCQFSLLRSGLTYSSIFPSPD